MTVRVEANQASAQGENLEFFVVTGSLEPPIVSLADNNGFPWVRDLYARQTVFQERWGVHVSVRFEEAAVGNVLAVNIFQPGMQGDFPVIPLV